MALIEAETPVATNPKPLDPQLNAKLKRHDDWWVQPALVFVGFVLFIIYATWRCFENNYAQANQSPVNGMLQYLSPFYSPYVSEDWMLFGKHVSPALFILPIPLLFRATCYYYRKAYYRAFFWDPPACAVPELRKTSRYSGEREFPLVVQNIHRYAFYLAVIILVVLWWDAIIAFTALDTLGNRHFYIGVGTLIMLANVILLSFYTFSCHAWRHLSGGCLNCFSCSSESKVRHSLWERISHYNETHAVWAWLSLGSVVITDFYIRGLATGAIHDIGRMF